MLDELQDRSESGLRAEVEALKAQVGRLTALLSDGGDGAEVGHPRTLAPEQRTDRRGLLKVAGAAAVGVAGAGLLKAAPAGAQGTANGQAVQLGEMNTCSATTQIQTSGGDGLNAFAFGGGQGVHGYAGGNGVGVLGVSEVGYGLSALSGFGVPLYLTPGEATGAPTTDPHQAGEVYVDANGVFWGCVAGGTPGTWRSLVEQLIPLNPPKRAYDSRVVYGGPGPLASGATSAHISLTSAGVPAGASAALINLTVVDTVKSGFLTLFKAGATQPETSNINWYEDGQVMANNATTSLSANGAVQVYSGGIGAQTDFLIDVFGYYP